MKKKLNRAGQIWECNGVMYVVVESTPYAGTLHVVHWGWTPRHPTLRELNGRRRSFTRHKLLSLNDGSIIHALDDNAEPFTGNAVWVLVQNVRSAG